MKRLKLGIDIGTSATVGASMLTGVGVGIYEDFDEAVSKCVNVVRQREPVPDDGAYKKSDNTYLSLYRNLKDLMSET